MKPAHTLQALPQGGTRVTYRTEVTGPDAADTGATVSGDFDQVLASLCQRAEADLT